jgi:hypothetical protein
MVPFDGVDDILALDLALHIKQLWNLIQQEAHMRRFGPSRRRPSSAQVATTAVPVLQAGDVRRILVCATHDAEIAVGRRATTQHHTLFVASHDSEIPMLTNGDVANGRFEVFERLEFLTDQEARYHLCHCEAAQSG